MNGDEVRGTWFSRPAMLGYGAAGVDDLLRRVAAELDAGRPAGPLIEGATFKTSGKRRYDIDAVDWFLARLAHPLDGSELAGLSFDPWRDLAVTQVTRSEVSDPVKRSRKMRQYFAQECANAWRNFGEHPGTYLRWERIRGRFLSSRWEFELRTADQQIIACLRGWPIGRSMTVSAGGRNFTVNSREIPGGSTAESWPPGIAALAVCSWRDQAGHYSAKTMKYMAQLKEARAVRELVDETGTPILHVSGTSYDHRTYARVTFPSQRWLRFLVRGTNRANAIMTAIDQDGNKVARYRITRRDRLNGVMVEAEIAVHPGQRLTDELILAIAISPPWLHRYLTDASGGGG